LQGANATAAATTTAGETAGQERETSLAQGDLPSLISVEVLGYGGGEGDEEEDNRKGHHGKDDGVVN
jgi:hypothetical protein